MKKKEKKKEKKKKKIGIGISSTAVLQMQFYNSKGVTSSQGINFPNFEYQEIKDAPVTSP